MGEAVLGHRSLEALWRRRGRIPVVWELERQLSVWCGREELQKAAVRSLPENLAHQEHQGEPLLCLEPRLAQHWQLLGHLLGADLGCTQLQGCC